MKAYLLNDKAEYVLGVPDFQAEPGDPRPFRCCFMDPPDNIGLKYSTYNDKQATGEYIDWLETIIRYAIDQCEIVWISYNAKWTFAVSHIIYNLLGYRFDLVAKPCIQTFTFGQHNQRDLGNNHRPLIRLMHVGTELYPDQIRVPSWRQEHGDSRADPRGRIPGDVFDFPRVTGNSKQRRTWHPTQLHEGLVERCLNLSCKSGDLVIDPFGGTGTTLRVCRKLNLDCALVEVDPMYCEKIAEEHGMTLEYPKYWTLNT